MLGDISRVDEIYLICGYTDLRKSIDGLCSVVEELLHFSARRNALFLFCGRRCDRIKALLYEPDGFLLFYKRLDFEGRYRWPRSSSEAGDSGLTDHSSVLLARNGCPVCPESPFLALLAIQKMASLMITYLVVVIL